MHRQQSSAGRGHVDASPEKGFIDEKTIIILHHGRRQKKKTSQKKS
jgi:hypothetical protein